MLEITSTGCGKLHHAEFRLRFDNHTAVERDARELVACLEYRVAAGASFRHGDHFPYGWLDLRFRQVDENLLAVEEPDFRNLPVQYVDGVTNSLCHLQWQKECASSAGIDTPLAMPTMTQTAAICPRIQDTGSFFMERQNAAPPGSGWTIGCAEAAHDHVHGPEMVRASLYELVTRFHTGIAAFLALPPGTKVLNAPHGLWISCKGRSHQIRHGSFLDHLQKPAHDSQTALILVDDAHNLLTWPPGKEIPSYSVPVSRRLSVRCEDISSISAPPEIQTMGIREPNTAVLLSKGVQWRKAWEKTSGVEFDLGEAPGQGDQGASTVPFGSDHGGEGKGNESDTALNGTQGMLKPGDELILVVGYADSGPDSITKGGIAAMWSGRLKVEDRRRFGGYGLRFI